MESDTSTRDDVIAELDFEPSLDHKGIGVAVEGGVVTLSGHVPSFAQKINAETAAKRVKGVRAVAIELQVRLPSDAKRDDDEIAARATHIIAWSVPAENLKIVVEKGWVTLTGDVEWQYQRSAADHAVRKLTGVIGVTNQIAVRPVATPADIRLRISDAFRRNADLESTGIKVDVQGSNVTLSGHVRAWSERAAAAAAAWAAPGVKHVTDDITIV